jgi:hypothetical protein
MVKWGNCGTINDQRLLKEIFLDLKGEKVKLLPGVKKKR